MTTYRAAFLDGGLSVKSWKASGSLRPFVKQILDVRRLYHPGVLGIAWDAPREQSWRRQRSAEYKAKREPVQPGFTTAINALRADLPALDVMQFSAPGAEADDVLHSLALTRPGPTLLVSADKDLRQCIRLGVDLLRPGQTYRHPDELITAANSEHDAGWWRSFLTLAGDPVDGIPGLPGVGKKRAEEILEACPEFVELLCAEDEEGSLGWNIASAREQCYAHSAAIAKHVERAIAHLPELRLSHELVTLRLVEVDCVDAEPDAERAAEVLRAAHLEAA